MIKFTVTQTVSLKSGSNILYFLFLWITLVFFPGACAGGAEFVGGSLGRGCEPVSSASSQFSSYFASDISY